MNIDFCSALLDICKEVCQQLYKVPESDLATVLFSANEQQLLREMKDSFVKRDYVEVFDSSTEHLQSYFANYVPTRSLWYA